MRWIRISASLVGLVLVAAACGGGARAGSGSSQKTADDQLVEFTKCMRDHGVDVQADADEEGRSRIRIEAAPDGDGSTGKNAAPDPKVEEAMKACEDKMPKGGQDLTPEERAELEDQMLEFAKCMREHGIDMPDPGEGGFFQKRVANGEDSAGSGPDPESEEFKAAEKACEDKLPNRGSDRGLSRREAA